MRKLSGKFRCTFAYALMQCATWSYYAIILAFSSNVLYTFGFTDSTISLFMGGFTALSVVVQVAAGELLSRFRKLGVHRILIAFGAAMLVCPLVLMIPGCSKPLAIIAFGMVCMLLQTIPSLANSFGMDTIRRGAPTDYSIARGMGSLGYSVTALLTGAMVRQLGVEAVHVLTIANSLLLIASALWYQAVTADVPQLVSASDEESKGSFFARYPRFTVLLAGMSLLCVSHGLLCNFMYQIMLSRNGGAMEQGIATAISALVELPIMFGFPLMLRKTRCDKWVRFAAFAIALKPLMILISGAPVGIYLAQATQSIGYGLWVIGSVNYAERVVKGEDSIRAQTYHGAVSTVSTVVALSAGGVIIEYLGVQIMVGASLVCSLVGAVIVLLSAQKTE